MPDTLTPEDIQVIRDNVTGPRRYASTDDVIVLLAHIDALTAAVPEMVAVAITGLPNGGGVTYNEAKAIGEKVLRAILRGES